MTSDSQLVKGPFFKGETLKFTVDPSTPTYVSVSLEYDATAFVVGSKRGPFSFTVPHQIASVFIVGNDNVNHLPGIWKITNFQCVAAAVGSKSGGSQPSGPATDVAATPTTLVDDGSVEVTELLVLGFAALAGTLIYARPRIRRH